MDEKKAQERREQRLAREKELYAGEVTMKYLYNPAQGVWPGRITVHGIIIIILLSPLTSRT
jgi:hypothetical protein